MYAIEQGLRKRHRRQRRADLIAHGDGIVVLSLVVGRDNEIAEPRVELPRLLERAGNTMDGSITGLYTVLVEGDEMDDPIADATRAILDGHLVLSRRLASRGHYPPVDVMESISRSMKDVVSPAHWERSLEIKSMLAAYAEAEDLVNIGAYARGSNPRIDRALEFIEPIEEFLKQSSSDSDRLDHNVQRFMGLLEPPAVAKAPPEGS